MTFERASGILMHITSLPGKYGIGCFGKDAEHFVDYIKSMGFSYWQVLPFGPTDMYNSPYKSFSAFAGNPLFIDLENLHHRGLLTKDELTGMEVSDPYRVDFSFVNKHKIQVLKKAYARLDEVTHQKIDDFVNHNKDWLPDYALYMAVKEQNDQQDWYRWDDEDLKLHRADALSAKGKELEDDVHFQEFLQYEFFTQWQCLKSYANNRGIKLIGDIPIYVSLESADVWSNRDIFDLDEEGRPNHVAGVPPDYFCADGQLWGNPLYRWDDLKKSGYKWWGQRLRYATTNFDAIRIDHFRGFSAYWAVDRDAETAREGQWVEGPGMDFFDAMEPFLSHGEATIIAEDLGVQDENLTQLMADTGYPGMRVFQFAFIEEGDNTHFPHNYTENSVAYTGTHDNNTLLGYLWELLPHEREYALEYVNFDADHESWSDGGPKSRSCQAFVRALMQSAASLAIIPIQDILGFGGDTKMNRPGVADGNWAFRVTNEALDKTDKTFYERMNIIYKRYR